MSGIHPLPVVTLRGRGPLPQFRWMDNMTGYFDKKCYHEDTYGDCYTECVFCKMSNGRQYEDEPSMSEDPHPYCGIYIESFPKPCKYHHTADELKELIDSGVIR